MAEKKEITVKQVCDVMKPEKVTAVLTPGSGGMTEEATKIDPIADVIDGVAVAPDGMDGGDGEFKDESLPPEDPKHLLDKAKTEEETLTEEEVEGLSEEEIKKIAKNLAKRTCKPLEGKGVSEFMEKAQKEAAVQELYEEIKKYLDTAKKKQIDDLNAHTNYGMRGKTIIPSRYGTQPGKCMKCPKDVGQKGKGKVNKIGLILVDDVSGSGRDSEGIVNKVMYTTNIAEQELYPKFTFEVFHLGNRLEHITKEMAPRSKDLNKSYVRCGGGNSISEQMFGMLAEEKARLRSKGYEVFTVFMFDGYINTNEARLTDLSDEQIVEKFKELSDKNTYYVSAVDSYNHSLFKKVFPYEDDFKEHYKESYNYASEAGNRIAEILAACRTRL